PGTPKGVGEMGATVTGGTTAGEPAGNTGTSFRAAGGASALTGSGAGGSSSGINGGGAGFGAGGSGSTGALCFGGTTWNGRPITSASARPAVTAVFSCSAAGPLGQCARPHQRNRPPSFSGYNINPRCQLRDSGAHPTTTRATRVSSSRPSSDRRRARANSGEQIIPPGCASSRG